MAEKPPSGLARADVPGEMRGARATGTPDAHPAAHAHHLIVRACHWVAAASIICLMLSGWQIHNASPLLPFRFPAAVTLGGWLGGAIAWHLASMWGLLAAGLIYLTWGVASGHFRRDLAPSPVADLRRDVAAALRFDLAHDFSGYNAVQRLVYSSVILIVIFAVISGLAIWKPVQLAPLTAVLGDYDTARALHFTAMWLIAAFLLLHLTLVALVPRSLRAMILGRAYGGGRGLPRGGRA